MSALIFGSLGLMEILLVLFLVILIFGAKRLPQIGSGLGKGIRNFKDSITGKDEAIESGDKSEP